MPTVRRLLPPELPTTTGPPRSAIVLPAGDTRFLLTHLMTEHLLVGLFRSVMQSAISEQLARIYTMRLAADNARRLEGELTAQCNLARRNAITNGLLEIVAGYDATVHRGTSSAVRAVPAMKDLSQ